MTIDELQTLSDAMLLDETKRVADVERRSMADLLNLLIEVERRGLHLSLGHSSLFAYCTRVLHFSEQAAYSRITASRAVRRYPSLLKLLADGSLTLSSIGLLAPHLTDDNVDALLEDARHKSTRDVERLIATVHPQPDIAASVRALPSSSPQPVLAECPVSDLPVRTAVSPVLPAVQRSSARAVTAPLAPKRYLLRVTIGQETFEKLERVKTLMRYTVPDGDPAVIIDRALALLLQHTERTKFAAASRPRRHEPPSQSQRGRRVPAAVRRAVWARDDGRCAFEGAEGRCGETAFLEYHHVLPYAVGGSNDVHNLQLRCRAHNLHEAALFLGGSHTAAPGPSAGRD